VGVLSFGAVRDVVDFVTRQEDAFKVNLLRNQASNFASNLTTQFQPIFLSALGASPLILGYMASLSGLIGTVISIPIGNSIDKVGIRKALLVGTFLMTLSAVVFSVASGWQIAVVAFILSTFGFTLSGTACPMICGTMLKSHERASGMGLCDTISALPGLAAPIIGAFIITSFGGMNVEGLRPLYYLQAVGFVVSLIIIYLWLKVPPFIGENSASRNFFADLKHILFQGKITKRWIALSMLSSFPMQVGFYITLFAANVKGANQFVLGGMSIASSLIMVVLGIPIGRIADRFGRKKVITSAVLLVCLSYLILIYAPNSEALLLCGLLSGFGITVFQIQMAISADLVTKEYLGSWYGLLGFFRGLINIVSPIICGYVWSAFSPAAFLFLLFGVQLMYLGMLTIAPTSITR